MRDLLPALLAWRAAGRRAALATVVRTWSSAPRPPGAAMAVAEDGQVVGSVSGGCVEGAVYTEAQDVLATGRPRVVRYGVSDDDAFAVGLTCGGEIEVLVQPADAATFPELDALATALGERYAIALVTVLPDSGAGRLVVTPEEVTGSLGSASVDVAVAGAGRELLAEGHTGLLTAGSREVLVESFVPPPRLLIFGATDLAAALARLGGFLGYTVTVCDARPVFATPQRFPDVDELVVDWPHRFLAATAVDERTAVCVLTHDAKFDVPLLEVALRSRAGYVGMLGSRRTRDDRLHLLRGRGLRDDELARLRSPIGLDLGGRTPAEMALSIAAEITAAREGAGGVALREGTGPIHRPPVR